MAMTCWAPMSDGTRSKSVAHRARPPRLGASVLPSPCSLPCEQVSHHDYLLRFSQRGGHPCSHVPHVAGHCNPFAHRCDDEPRAARDSSCAARERREAPRAVTGARSTECTTSTRSPFESNGRLEFAPFGSTRHFPASGPTSSNTGRAVCSQRTRGVRATGGRVSPRIMQARAIGDRSIRRVVGTAHELLVRQVLQGEHQREHQVAMC